VFLRIVLILAVFGIAVYFGVSASRRYIGRELYFNELTLFCGHLVNEIGFTHAPLCAIAEKYAAAFKSHLSAQLFGAAHAITERNILDEEVLRLYVPRGALTEDEYDTVIQFFNTLGKSDSESQINSIESFKLAFRQFQTGAAADRKKYGSLSWKLGLLAAGAVGILII
jgi:stage III sporulation protein AB